MIKKLAAVPALWEAFQTGKKVSNVTAWKKGQVNVNALVAFLSACVGIVAVVFGVEIQVAQEQLSAIAESVIVLVSVGVGLFNIIATVVSTTRAGLQGFADAEDSTRPDT